MLYPLVETFTSIQGEGLFAGAPANFIRLAGCNLSCDFCDTNHAAKLHWPASRIAEKMNPNVHIVVITGGEPLIHDLHALVSLLKTKGYTVHLETNGTHRIPFGIDYVSVSPKKNPAIDIHGHTMSVICGPVDEAKWLFPMWDPTEIIWALADHHFIQPVNHKATIHKRHLRACVKIVKEAWPEELRLSVQLHKLLEVR